MLNKWHKNNNEADSSNNNNNNNNNNNDSKSKKPCNKKINWRKVNFIFDFNSILEYIIRQKSLLTSFHVCRVDTIRISIHNDPPWRTFFMLIKSHYRNIGYGVWISVQHFTDLIGQLLGVYYKSTGRKLGNAWSRRIKHYNK